MCVEMVYKLATFIWESIPLSNGRFQQCKICRHFCSGLLLFLRPVMSDFLRPHGLPACRAPLSLTFSQSLPKFMSIASVMPSSWLIILWCLFFCLQSFPASGTFPVNWLFASDDQNTGVHLQHQVLPTSIQGWFPLRLTDLISLLSEGLWGVFSSTTVGRHQFFGVLPSLRSSSHSCTWPLGRP